MYQISSALWEWKGFFNETKEEDLYSQQELSKLNMIKNETKIHCNGKRSFVNAFKRQIAVFMGCINYSNDRQ